MMCFLQRDLLCELRVVGGLCVKQIGLNKHCGSSFEIILRFCNQCQFIFEFLEGNSEVFKAILWPQISFSYLLFGRQTLVVVYDLYEMSVLLSCELVQQYIFQQHLRTNAQSCGVYFISAGHNTCITEDCTTFSMIYVLIT